MADEKRRSPDLLSGLEALAREPHRAQFFAAVDAIERSSEGHIGADHFDDEAVFFRHSAKLDHPVSEVVGFAPPAPESPEKAELRCNLLGLSGSEGCLPLEMASELAADTPDAALQRNFLDLFHHRFLALLYRGTRKYTLHRSSGEDDPWPERILCLLGFDFTESEATPHFDPRELLAIAPSLLAFGCSADNVALALQTLLRSDLEEGASIELSQFQGRWSELGADQQSRLGELGCRLGVDFVAGNEVPHRAGKARLRIGPLSAESYARFSPGAPAYLKVGAILRALIGDTVDFDLELELRGDERGGGEARLGACSLGENAWLAAEGPLRRRVSLTYDPQTALASPPESSSHLSGGTR